MREMLLSLINPRADVTEFDIPISKGIVSTSPSSQAESYVLSDSLERLKQTSVILEHGLEDGCFDQAETETASLHSSETALFLVMDEFWLSVWELSPCNDLGVKDILVLSSPCDVKSRAYAHFM